MLFDFGGHTYAIDFKREHRERYDGSLSRYPYTTANIHRIDDPKLPTEKNPVFRTYTVGCSHRDRFSFEAGRKAALTMAIYDAPDGDPKYGALTKEFRTAVWTAYHSRPGSKVKPPVA